MFYHPALAVAHHRRKDLRSLFRPTLLAGYYRSKVMLDKSTKNSSMFWLPSLFVLLHLVIFISPTLFGVLTRIYLGLIVMMSLNIAARKRNIGLFAYVALLHYFIVFVYGLGFLSHRLGFRESK